MRLFVASLWLIAVWLTTPRVFAECPGGGQCMTLREAQACEVCIDEQDALRRESREAEALLNVRTGERDEARRQVKKLQLERDDYRDQWREASGGPSWWTVVGVGVGALLVGGVGGLVVGL